MITYTQNLMQKVFFSFLFIVFASYNGFGQISDIKGKLTDSSSNLLVSNAVVSVLRQQDSVLIKFSRSDKNGNFQIQNLDSGKYIILVSYPKYGDYVDLFNLKKGEDFNFNTIYLTQKAKLLQEIIIRQSAVRIKGDTT